MNERHWIALERRKLYKAVDKTMLKDLVREKLLTIMNTKAYTQFNPEQLLLQMHVLQ